MLYEKKLMILSGQGKGVVLIEKSGLGVKFALRTFSLPARADCKAGIITPQTVIVRDLPATRDPAAVFFVDDVSLEGLHFAVFDTRLRLYGTTGVKMWEANVMDILLRHSAPPVSEPPLAPPSLPPLAGLPHALPLPDGTGIPQSRLALYGDEAIAESDFYTSFDLDAHLPRIDAFLDGERALNATAAAPELAGAVDVSAVESAETSERIDLDEQADENAPDIPPDAPPVSMPNPSIPPNALVGDIIGAESVAGSDETREATASEPTAPAETTIEEDMTIDTTNINGISERSAAQNDRSAVSEREAAACVDTRGEKPWEMTARWLKERSTREPIVRKHAVPQKSDVLTVPKLREVSFFERLGADINKLFSTAPRDGELTALLPDIEWVRVDVDKRNSVSVGRSGNAFLCYAVAGSYEKIPPIENAQWLPKLRTAPTGKGYWLVFQDLGSGNVIV